MTSLLLSAMLLLAPNADGRGSNNRVLFQPKPKIRDTAELLGHRWLITSTETAGKKTGAKAGLNSLYMNFFSNGGFDFVGIGDGDLLIWKYAKGSVSIYRKSPTPVPAEAVYRIEKITAKVMVISGLQAGAPVRYYLEHEAGD